MTEFFIVANSFAAPFFSDTSHHFIKAADPETALERFAAKYEHPCGLYSANAYASADAYHKDEPRLAQWLSNHAKGLADTTADLHGYSMLGKGPGVVEINGVEHRFENPKAGTVQ